MIQDDRHRLVVLRHIGASPPRAGMVADATDDRWSSDLRDGLGRDDPPLSGFPEWDELRPTEAERRRRWRLPVCGGQP